MKKNLPLSPPQGGGSGRKLYRGWARSRGPLCIERGRNTYYGQWPRRFSRESIAIHRSIAH
ncbi:MAG: hypothetical protein ACHQPH_10670, partial [Reyranellales bacterium]